MKNPNRRNKSSLLVNRTDGARKRASRSRNRRLLRTERLESRQLMAADLLPDLHNADRPTDVNGDGQVTSGDALAIINYMTRTQTAETEQRLISGLESVDHAEAELPVPMKVDVDNSGFVSAIDALMVINELAIESEAVPASTGLPGPLDYTLFPKAGDVNSDGMVDAGFDVLKNFKTLDPGNLDFEYVAEFNDQFQARGADSLLTTDEVETLLDRASAATRSEDGIIAVVDRNGTILGVRVEQDILDRLPKDSKQLAFAIDGAVAKARTAAFFASGAAPLTSRTIRSLSQSTVTQREVDATPYRQAPEKDPDGRFQGPGFVAPIGVGGKFPPEVNFTPQVDLFGIEHQSRDSQLNAGEDRIRGTADDFYLRTRFNADPVFIPKNAEGFFQSWPESYGLQTEQFRDSQSRGIATLPGGVPLYKKIPGMPSLSKSINLVGGIGVFYPGDDGYASFEQEFIPRKGQSEKQRTNATKVLEAEFSAFIAAAGDGLFNPFQSAFVRDLRQFNHRLPPLKNYVLPTGRIDLVGITLEIFGPNPTRAFRKPGVDRLIAVGLANFGGESSVSGELVKVNHDGDLLLSGEPVPEGWLVTPHDSKVDTGLTAEIVDQIIANGVVEAQRTRAAIRLDIDGGFRPGERTRMVLSVTDTTGELLGLYRMPDATIFSIDVSVAKARNTSYYADVKALQDFDRVDFNGDGKFGHVSTSLNDPNGDTLPLGSALTNRTFRFLAEPRYPSGIELSRSVSQNLKSQLGLDLCDQKAGSCTQVAPQSILRLPGFNPRTAENLAGLDPITGVVVPDLPLPLEQYTTDALNTFSVLAFDAFVPSRNFRDLGDSTVVIHGDGTKQPLANQNGIVFFPGSTPLYVNGATSLLVGGFGVSGDGVDQDDVVTVGGQKGFAPPAAIRVDQFPVGRVRMPFQKFNRNPFGA